MKKKVVSKHPLKTLIRVFWTEQRREIKVSENPLTMVSHVLSSTFSPSARDLHKRNFKAQEIRLLLD